MYRRRTEKWPFSDQLTWSLDFWCHCRANKHTFPIVFQNIYLLDNEMIQTPKAIKCFHQRNCSLISRWMSTLLQYRQSDPCVKAPFPLVSRDKVGIIINTLNLHESRGHPADPWCSYVPAVGGHLVVGSSAELYLQNKYTLSSSVFSLADGTIILHMIK